MMPRREARLRAEFAEHYPYLTAGCWEPAAVLADRVIAYTLRRPESRFITNERALDPAHFEFRGWDPNVRPGSGTRRADVRETSGR